MKSVALPVALLCFDDPECQFLFTVKQLDYLNFRTSIYLENKFNRTTNICLVCSKLTARRLYPTFT